MLTEALDTPLVMAVTLLPGHIPNILYIFRGSRSRMFFKISVLKNCAKFAEKLACIFIKKTLRIC